MLCRHISHTLSNWRCQCDHNRLHGLIFTERLINRVNGIRQGGFLMIDPRMTHHLEYSANGIWRAKALGKVSYPADAHQHLYDIEDRSFWFQHRNHCIITVIDRFPPRGAIADIGGGNGFVTKGMIDAGYAAILIESGLNGVTNARSRGISDIIHATFENAGFEGDTIENTGLFDVLEHIENDAAFLSRIHRSLKPGGKLYLTVPAHPYLWSWTDIRAGHFRRYTARMVAKVLESSGFSIDYISYFFFGLSLPILFSRTIPTWLNRTPDRSHDQRKKTHRRPSGIIGIFMRQLWQNETRRLRNGRLACGSSLIAVARK